MNDESTALVVAVGALKLASLIATQIPTLTSLAIHDLLPWNPYRHACRTGGTANENFVFKSNHINDTMHGSKTRRFCLSYH
jgi:hypothetical protein